MEEANWSIPTDAEGYFRGQKKKAQMADRRPVFHRASDLAGPGIGEQATRITDFNDTLATYNGFFSAAPLAANRPVTSVFGDGLSYVGFVTADPELGGLQVFTELTSGTVYRRVFQRGAMDRSLITWGPWAEL